MRRKNIIIVSILVVIVAIVIGIGLDIVKASPAVGGVMLNHVLAVNTPPVNDGVKRAVVKGMVSDDLHVEAVATGVNQDVCDNVLPGTSVKRSLGVSGWVVAPGDVLQVG